MLYQGITDDFDLLEEAAKNIIKRYKEFVETLDNDPDAWDNFVLEIQTISSTLMVPTSPPTPSQQQ